MESIIAQIVHKFKFNRRSLGGGGLARFREYLNRFFWVLTAILLIVISFFLGRITKFMESSPVFTFESKEAEEQNYIKEKEDLFGLANTKVSTSTIVASKTGKKYYFVWCKGAGNIKPDKKIYFNTEELAQKAGYSLAASCK